MRLELRRTMAFFQSSWETVFSTIGAFMLITVETIKVSKNQGCPQDVKSQDWDETETINLQDRDETKMFHFFKLSRPRRDRDVEPSRPRRDRDVQPSRPRRDVPKNVSRPPRDRDAGPRRSKNVSRLQCRSLKTPTGEVFHLTTCFLRVRSIIFFVIYLHCMHVHKTKVTRPRQRRYIFKTETRPRRSIFPNSRDRDETETFNLQDRDETRRSKKMSRDRLETETFKTETTSLVRTVGKWTALYSNKNCSIFARNIYWMHSEVQCSVFY